jgi:hypothetical protein
LGCVVCIPTLDREVIDMASDKQAEDRSRLAMVFGAIVLALVLAGYFMYGHKGESTVKVDHPMTEAPKTPMTPAPTPMAPAPAAPSANP